MFSSDGHLLLGSDKATVMHKIEEIICSSTAEGQHQNQECNSSLDEVNTEQVVMFDGMAVINRIKLDPAIINCRQFAEALLKILQEESPDAKYVLFLTGTLTIHRREVLAKNEVHIFLYSTKFVMIPL